MKTISLSLLVSTSFFLGCTDLADPASGSDLEDEEDDDDDDDDGGDDDDGDDDDDDDGGDDDDDDDDDETETDDSSGGDDDDDDGGDDDDDDDDDDDSNIPPVVDSFSVNGGLSPDPLSGPGVVELAAVVADDKPPIARVEFYTGDKLIATVEQEPFVYAWPVAGSHLEGVHVLKARAVDRDGAIGESDAIELSVTDMPTSGETQWINSFDYSEQDHAFSCLINGRETAAPDNDELIIVGQVQQLRGDWEQPHIAVGWVSAETGAEKDELPAGLHPSGFDGAAPLHIARGYDAELLPGGEVIVSGVWTREDRSILAWRGRWTADGDLSWSAPFGSIGSFGAADGARGMTRAFDSWFTVGSGGDGATLYEFEPVQGAGLGSHPIAPAGGAIPHVTDVVAVGEGFVVSGRRQVDAKWRGVLVFVERDGSVAWEVEADLEGGNTAGAYNAVAELRDGFVAVGTLDDDILVERRSSTGKLLWQKVEDHSGSSDAANAVAVDGLGNVIVAGRKGDLRTDDAPTHIGDIWFGKWTEDGDDLWQHAPVWGAARAVDEANGICLHPYGWIYVVGTIQESWTEPRQGYDWWAAKVNP